MQQILQRWPGKSPAEEGGCPHPAVYHMLDVAAVAERLIEPWRLAAPLREALVFLVAIHDLGKIGAQFRNLLRHGQPQTSGSHWEVTEAYLYKFDVDALASRLGGDVDRRRALYAAAAGHHGRPPFRELSFNRTGAGPVGDWKRMLDNAGAEALADAATVIAAFLALWPQASIASLDLVQAKAMSWRLAGLATAADWIASNVAWFPATAPGPSIEEHLAASRERAFLAVSEAGLNTPSPGNGPLYDFAVRPMQAACADIGMREGPMLAIIEDETGSGKTEAALILARRMLAVGKGSGLYFALPTMATADAMFARVAQVISRLYVGAPSLALAHGRAPHSALYRELKDARAHNPDEPGPSEWLADNRRRALLADVGVGTIDQALLAVMGAKHAALRLFGLSSKILIVDEVHEVGDPYMGELLATLLEVHAAHGGSAILLSATVPLGLRAKLVAAFEKGAGREFKASDDPAYPALTIPGGQAIALPSTPSARGAVRVEQLDERECVLNFLAAQAAKGAACVWVRNAVDEAIDAFEMLRARGVEADLLHARFALVDRKRHEAAVLATFGKDRTPRPGCVLVATQVVESSLDLDFDVMVSDLAPMAALIQRAGRLWRHMDRRPASDRPVASPIFHVLSPDPGAVETDQWLRATLGGGAFVYPLALQWRTASVLFRAGSIEAPSGLRALIEEAHGDEIDVPPALERADQEALGKAGARQVHARQNRIDWAAGYRAGAQGADDADYPTRLGEPQRILVLARRDAGKLIPWSDKTWSVEACQRSEVQAAERRIRGLSLPDQSAPEIAAILRGLPDWIGSSRTICEVGENGAISEGLRYDADLGLLATSPHQRR